ncbi:MAG: hypothetical protein HC905_03885 [Bacteroidales bacterium]|nr:hypothetical protein [Bacteroidales bacterium]
MNSTKKFYEIINQQNEKYIDSSDEKRDRIYSKIEKMVLPTKRKRHLNLLIPAVAASFLIILSIFSLVKLSKEPETIYLESTTPYGVRTKLILADSTVVFLNAGSYIKYPAKFVDKTRKIFFHGEAYFDVKKDPEHPFIVQTGDLSIKVLGTQFNVKNYQMDENIETTLINGSVGVYSQNDTDFSLELMANEQALYDKTKRDFRKRKVDAELSAIWKDGKFYFDNEPLSKVVMTLEQNFNIKIKIHSKKLENKIFSGLFG